MRQTAVSSTRPAQAASLLTTDIKVSGIPLATARLWRASAEIT